MDIAGTYLSLAGAFSELGTSARAPCQFQGTALLLGRAAGRRELVTAILLPHVLAGALRRRALLAVGDGLDAQRVDAEADEVVVRCLGALITEHEVVLGGATLVGVT